MLYYVYIFTAVLMFVAQFAIMKFYQKSVKQTVITTLLFVFIISLVSVPIFLAIGGFSFTLTSFWFAVAFIVAAQACNILGIIIVSLGKISGYTMFMMLGGTVLPFFYGIIFLKEEVTVFKIIGIIVMVAALILPIFQKSEEKQTKKVLYYILCFAAFLANGAVSVITKMHQLSENIVGSTQFIVLYSLAGAAISLIGLGLVFCFCKEKKAKFETLKQVVRVKPLALSAAFAVVNGVGNMLLLISASKVDASIQYPIVTGGTIILSAVAGTLFFKEKQKKLDIIALALMLAATIIFVL